MIRLSTGRDLKWNVRVHLSVTRGGLANDNNSWKTLFFSKQALMPMWRYEITHLLREAYRRGELKLPKKQQAACPDKTAFNRWLNDHYQSSIKAAAKVIRPSGPAREKSNPHPLSDLNEEQFWGRPTGMHPAQIQNGANRHRTGQNTDRTAPLLSEL